MVNYFLGASEPIDSGVQSEQFDLQRRSDVSAPTGNSNQGMIPLSTVLEANKNTNNATGSETTLAPPAPVPSQVPEQVKLFPSIFIFCCFANKKHKNKC